jgi:hypothetical protein
MTITMSRATHVDPAALVAACVIAACASWALEGASPSLLLAMATDEAREAAQALGIGARLAEILTQLSAGTWDPPAIGISLDPIRDSGSGAVVHHPSHLTAQRPGQRGPARRRHRHRRRPGRRPDGLQANRRASTRRTAMAQPGRPARTGKRDGRDRRRAGHCPDNPVWLTHSRQKCLARCFWFGCVFLVCRWWRRCPKQNFRRAIIAQARYSAFRKTLSHKITGHTERRIGHMKPALISLGRERADQPFWRVVPAAEQILTSAPAPCWLAQSGIGAMAQQVGRSRQRSAMDEMVRSSPALRQGAPGSRSLSAGCARPGPSCL